MLTNIDEGQGEYVNTYDTRGKVVKQTHGSGEINFTYAAPYSFTTITTLIKDPSGTMLNTQTRKVTFSNLGFVSQTVDSNGNYTLYTRNGHGWIISEAHYDGSNTLLSSATYSYDHSYECTQTSEYLAECHSAGPEKGNVTSKTDSLGNTTTYTYHPTFNGVLTESVKSVLNPAQNRVITNTYDDTTGNLLSVNETGLLDINTAYTYTTTYTYDANGKVTSSDGPRTDVQDIVSFTYGSVNGNLLTMTQPIIGTTTYSDHDAIGNPRTVTDSNGNRLERQQHNLHL